MTKWSPQGVFYIDVSTTVPRLLSDVPEPAIISLSPENAVFGFSDISDKDYSIVNQLLLLFKYYIYNAANRKHLSLKL